MNPLLVSSGEPAGIGPDLCLALAKSEWPLVILGDKQMLATRAKQLGLSLTFNEYQQGTPPSSNPTHLTVLSIPCPSEVTPGVLNPENAAYVISMLALATDRCLAGEFSGLVTAPVNKAVINQAGILFTGHTEFLAERCHAEIVVMMLACEAMKVALVTTHLPLRSVPDAITPTLIMNVATCLDTSFRQFFSKKPRIYVAGLNPHAGESGYLGREEIEVISPALKQLKQMGIDVHGPFPADTMFTPRYAKACDVFLAMYHDQGLAVLKYAGFGQAVNVTLGLPIIRTSVDHGTALELAGTGNIDSGSLLAAVNMAASMVNQQKK